MNSARKIFHNAKFLTLANPEADLEVLDRGILVVNAAGTIEWIGRGNDFNWAADGLDEQTEKIDLGGKLVTPGLVDCHTHLVYGGSRADEWQQRLNGISYEEIAKAGGGIRSTVQATRAATLDELVESGRHRLAQLVMNGATTLEVKSGYGLDTATELKMLQAAQAISEETPVEFALTFLGAHALPVEYDGRADDYIDCVVNEMFPEAKGMVEAVDVFCEGIGFNLSQTERVLDAAIDAGLAIKIHAEQLSNLGGAKLAAEKKAWSADHLEYIDEPSIEQMAANGTVAVLLPGAFYFINETQKPPIDLFRKHGVPIAIATDLNPGSSPVFSLPLMANFACTLFQMTPAEAICGITIHAARALRREDRIGSLEVGKQADLAVWDIQSPAELAYGIGPSFCLQRYKRGQLIDLEAIRR